ncbi:unnamed protein product [Rotaria sp. Silwood1]|nr:unnamed protein product [Rotaria sp. Silwood1]
MQPSFPMNTDYNKESIKMSDSNTQAAWYELLPPTPVLNGQEQDFENNKLQLKKKKCHGNRRLQRFRKRCRARGMNDQTIKMLLTMHSTDNSIHQANQETDKDKDMDDSFAMNINNDVQVGKFYEYQNQYQSSPSRRTHQKSTDHWKQLCKLLPNYKNLSHRKFKYLLSNVIPTYRQQIQQYLANTEMLQFVQQLTQLLCTFFQLKIEEAYWNYIADLNLPIMTWLSNISKDVTLQNSINWDHSKTKQNIQNRQNIIQNKLQQMAINLYNHLQRYSSSLGMDNNMTFEQSINIIQNPLLLLIEKDLHSFRTNFEQKIILLSYDINDAHLVKSFYDLNPIQEQMECAQQIWRSKLKVWTMPTLNLNCTNPVDYRTTILATKVQVSHFKMKQMKEQSKTITIQPKTTARPIEFILWKTIGSDFQSNPDFLYRKNQSISKRNFKYSDHQ